MTVSHVITKMSQHYNGKHDIKREILRRFVIVSTSGHPLQGGETMSRSVDDYANSPKVGNE